MRVVERCRVSAEPVSCGERSGDSQEQESCSERLDTSRNDESRARCRAPEREPDPPARRGLPGGAIRRGGHGRKISSSA